MTRPHILACLTCVAFVLVSTPTFADGLPLHFGVGAKSGLNTNILTPPDVSSDVNPPLPAFVGNGGGVGLAAEVLYGDFVGLELDVWYVTASGEGSFTFISSDAEVTVGQALETRELHIPLLIKGQVPLRYVKPHMGLGVTFVQQISTRYAVDNPMVTTNIIDPPLDAYTMLTAQLGASIDLGDIRIPLELRALWLPLGRDPSDRAQFEYDDTDRGLILSDFSVNAAWELQLWMMLGVQYWDSTTPW